MAAESSYEEFEPFCKWRKEEGTDTLEIHLQGFKKEQLKVQLNNLGVLRIDGERWVNEQKRTGFQKEITLSKDVKTNEIRAKFSNGVLYMIMPKQTPPLPPPPIAPFSKEQPETLPPKTQEHEPKVPEKVPEVVPRKTVNSESYRKEDDMIKEKGNYGTLKIEINRRMAQCIVAVALMMAIGAFLMCFRSSHFEL